MRSTVLDDHASLLVCTSLCVSGAAISCFLYPKELTLALALVSFVPPLWLAFISARRQGIVEPCTLFALAFAAYNGLILVRYNYVGDPGIYPFGISDSMFCRAGIVSAAGSLGVVAGWLVANKEHPRLPPQRTELKCSSAFLTGIIFLLIGVAFYMLQYWQLGGYLHAVSLDRGVRFQMLRNTLSMPYDGFVVSGLALMTFSSVGVSRARLAATVAACCVWLGLIALQGDRRLILQAAMVLALVLGTLKPSLVKLRLSAVIATILAYLAFIAFGQYRTLIYDLAGGSSTIRQAEVTAEGEKTEWSKPEQGEFGGPYVSVFYYLRGNPSLLWGSSYFWSLPAALPKVLYPGTKQPAISADMDNALHEGSGPVYGWGFNPVAEAYANFGLAGAFLIMAGWSTLFVWFGAIRFRGIRGLVVCATVLQEAVNSNRIDFRYVYFEGIGCIGTGLLAVAFMQLFEQHSRRVKTTTVYFDKKRSFAPL